ncbi:GTP cyclohydrolase II [Sphingomonas sp. S6]|jgi:GTP cyclohydrolase II|uniref:GTP cyclohydrolase II n=1 Tax=Sphingomonas sp. S6 TaxID=3368600 RepID=UPI000FC17E9E|nr:GTP cyclohydrolase II [uncultured Sphingomonas sp.]RTL16618.1 MAG: GTP cyclohydrolase II [Sphingomonadaceae bacterium]
MSASARDVARAIDALRRGWPIAIAAPGEAPLPLLAVETADPIGLESFVGGGAFPLLISNGRAATLKLTNQLAAADPDTPVAIEPAPWLDFSTAVALADPQFDLATPLKGPFRTMVIDRPAASLAAIRLARIAGLLPAFFLDGTGAEVTIDPAAIDAHQASSALRLATRARLPVDGAEDAEIVAFRSPDSSDEHVALLVGQPNGSPPLVRLHSECLTGDVLGSLKCDCGPQLRAAIEAIKAQGWGILLYLRQEGRGIGLVNKLRAYALQDQGFDTVDANTRLGFAIDARDFGVAARMLSLLGQRSVRLLTNNPAKVAGLEAAGVTVIERVAHALPPNPHNARYLATKRDRTGHQL